MEGLELGRRYKREEVHSIFCPSSETIGGTWLQQGMFRIDKKHNNWIFYISLGHKQGDYQFIESISEAGILSWQTQPSLSFKSPAVKSLLDFDIETDKIYLFFRLDKDKRKDRSYMYLGKLDYYNYDNELQQPVHISWRLLDWDKVKDNEFIQEIFEEQRQLKIRLQPHLQTEHIKPRKGALKEVSAPTASNKARSTNSDKNGRQKKNRVGTLNLRPSRLKQIGDNGEKLVLQYEIEQLKNSPFPHLAEDVIHSSVVEGDGLGYDILSYCPDKYAMYKDKKESIKYIEVKTTNQRLDAPFFISGNELDLAKEEGEKFLLYRVYLPDRDKQKENEEDANETFSFYVIDGKCLLEEYEFTPASYKVSLK